MARVKFTADYDHTWPSRAVTAFKANWEGSVKAEVAEAAVAAGKARRVKLEGGETKGVEGGRIDGGKPKPTLPGNLPPELAEPQALTPNLHLGDE